MLIETKHQYNVGMAKFTCYVDDYAYLSKGQLDLMRELAEALQRWEQINLVC